MRKYQITFVDEQISFSVETGKTVLQAQIDAGLTPDAFCGGTGKCGKCKVVIDGKEVLACQTVIDRDMTVYTGHKKTEQVQILTGGSGEKLLFQPGELPGNLEDPLLEL